MSDSSNEEELHNAREAYFAPHMVNIKGRLFDGCYFHVLQVNKTECSCRLYSPFLPHGQEMPFERFDFENPLIETLLIERVPIAQVPGWLTAHHQW